MLRGTDTICKALGDIAAFDNAGKIKNREGDCHRSRVTGQEDEINTQGWRALANTTLSCDDKG